MSGLDAAIGYRFLSGVEMDPAAILAAYPGARFVARARLTATAPSAAAGDAIWGIVIRLATPAANGAGNQRQVTTDDGRLLTAAVTGDGRPAGDAAAVLAAAKYWELPPAYVNRLARP